ncbi:MAG: SOS response-associated peptidase [Oceanihabitans sp.]
MCFHLKATKESQLAKAIRLGNASLIKKLKSKIEKETNLPLFHVSGFAHPKLVIHTSHPENPFEIAFWGLIPNWIKDDQAAKSIQSKTLNARSETIFEKPSFKDAIQTKRCIIYVDGFYEYKHINNKKYPHFIQQKNSKPLALAGLCSSWYSSVKKQTINTFTIVTIKGNAFMAAIHNNPKLKEPRMPLFLNEENETTWLNNQDNITEKTIQELQKQANKKQLKAHTVQALLGNKYLGNVKEVSQEFAYLELNNNLTLF